MRRTRWKPRTKGDTAPSRAPRTILSTGSPRCWGGSPHISSQSSSTRCPGEPAAEVAATLERLAGDDRIALRTVYAPIPSPPSPLTPAIIGPIERLVAEQFPNVPIVPVMEAGATDGLFLRNAGIPTYGVSAVFEEQNDVRAYGRDERLRVQSFYEALEFWYRMMQAFASAR